MNTTSHRSEPRAFSSDQRMVLWVLWLTYGSFYFSRNNLSVALPGIQAELGFSKTQLGTVLMALKLAYGAGQFINGQMAEHWQPRKLLALGLLASAALNVVFGWMTALYFLTFVWACNGYVQALGWPPTMRVAANWFPPLQRGRAIGIIGTGYQLCGALTFVVAGWAAERFGWRAALNVPAIIVAASAVHMLVFLKDKPAAEHALDDIEHSAAMANRSLRDNLAVTLTNPALWLVAVALLLLDACRYGFTDWGVTHLKEVQNASVGTAAFKYAVLPFGGIAGAYLSGWATDRFFKGRRAPVICMLLFVLGLLALAYDSVIHWGMMPSVAILFCIGFCIFGPQVLLVGTLPVDLARRGTAAAAVGFVNFMGYMGAAAGDKLTGRLAEDHGWPTAVRFWAVCAFAGAAVIACLWNVGARQEKSEIKDLKFMRAIIIAAGRGRRLMPTTADAPKCYAEINGKRMLDHALNAFAGAGITDVCFIGGYQIDKVRADYPHLTFRHNAGWEDNNILLSLMHAEDLMDDGFVCCYSDILFTSDVIEGVLQHPADIALSVDTRWLDRYEHRSQHPPDDAEKVITSNGLVTRVHRGITPDEAYGEYTGIAKFTAEGAASLRDHFHQARQKFAGKPFREASIFEKSYLILLLQEMIEAGIPMAHSDTPGHYMEVDTQEDFELARMHWAK